MLYSVSTGGFYRLDVHGNNIPADVVDVSEDAYLALLHDQCSGKQIQANQAGAPSAVEPPPPTHQQIEVLRLRAYSDPATGSDRYFTEASRLQAMNANTEEVKSVVATGVARYLDIQAQYPWPSPSTGIA